MSSPEPPAASSSHDSSWASSGSDESLADLSFGYEYDINGNVIRVSKDKSANPPKSPIPTPPTTSELPQRDPGGRRLSLSRSESMPATTHDALQVPTRPLTRTSSGTVTSATPSQTYRGASFPPQTSGIQGSLRKIGGAQRIRREEAEQQRHETDEKMRRESEETERERTRRAQAEKENAFVDSHYSPPQEFRQASILPSRQGQYSFSRPARQLVAAKKLNSVSRINEDEIHENEAEDADYRYQYYQRREPIEQQAYNTGLRSTLPEHVPLPHSRPNSVVNVTGKARRVTLEEKLRQEQEIAAEEEALAAMEVNESRPSRYSPPPSHQPNLHSGHYSQQSHQRRDSETLRGAEVPYSLYGRRNDPALESNHRISPSSRSLNGTTAVASRVRRSPTAPEKHSGGTPVMPNSELQGEVNSGKQVAIENGQRAQPLASRNLVVNKKNYARLNCIGRGGSSRVYSVMSNTNEVYAIKRVSLEKTDKETLKGYMNEIALLKRLEGNSRIIRLIDSEVRNGQSGGKGQLLLVMECGEIDLARLLQERQSEPLNLLWIGYYWQQILQAVQVIHDEKIVHSDLKPANFVLVKGQLKLIDFGIANAIANDTTNIQRDHQIGTVNYMSPEAIELPEGMRRLKVGRPSDVWSLGCILYQMIYGHPPFQHLSIYQKMKAIPDPGFEIEFPGEAVPSIPSARGSTDGGSSQSNSSPAKKLTHLAQPIRRDVIDTMKRCLLRAPKDRATIPDLLADDWLLMKEPTPITPPPPPPIPDRADLLAEDEAVINPFYMHQLLIHVYRTAASRRAEEVTIQDLEAEARRLVFELQTV